MSINSVPELRIPGPSGRQRTSKKGHVADIPGQLAGVASPVMERYVRKIYVHVTYMYIVYTHDTHDITSYSVDGCRRCILDHRCIQQPRSGEGHLGLPHGPYHGPYHVISSCKSLQARLSKMQPLAFASFFRVDPSLPRAKDNSSSSKGMVSRPQSSWQALESFIIIQPYGNCI